MPPSHTATRKVTPGAALAHDLVDRVEQLLLAAERAGQPIEIDPHRQGLFELFVLADAGGFLEEDAPHDLSCDGIARDLAARWDLAKGIGAKGIGAKGGGPSLPLPQSLPPAQLARLRLLWSFMRMWMEWTYAWKRWEEFHTTGNKSTRKA
jgi:hypothetical protein